MHKDAAALNHWNTLPAPKRLCPDYHNSNNEFATIQTCGR